MVAWPEPSVAQIKKPVIINETTIYGDQLRVLKSAGVRYPAAPVTTLAFNASYDISPNLIVPFDATKVTKVKRANHSEEAQLKLDVGGLQFYLNLKYKFW